MGWKVAGLRWRTLRAGDTPTASFFSSSLLGALSSLGSSCLQGHKSPFPVCEEKARIQESSREEITNCTQSAQLKPALGRWLSFFILIKPFGRAMARPRIPTSWRVPGFGGQTERHHGALVLLCDTEPTPWAYGLQLPPIRVLSSVLTGIRGLEHGHVTQHFLCLHND